MHEPRSPYPTASLAVLTIESQRFLQPYYLLGFGSYDLHVFTHSLPITTATDAVAFPPSPFSIAEEIPLLLPIT